MNKALSFAQFELRGCRNQYDGRVYYGLVNNVSDEQSKLGTKYSVPQIAFYKAIVSYQLWEVLAFFNKLTILPICLAINYGNLVFTIYASFVLLS